MFQMKQARRSAPATSETNERDFGDATHFFETDVLCCDVEILISTEFETPAIIQAEGLSERDPSQLCLALCRTNGEKGKEELHKYGNFLGITDRDGEEMTDPVPEFLEIRYPHPQLLPKETRIAFCQQEPTQHFR